MLVQQSIIGALGHVVLLQKSTIGALGRCRCSRVLYCISTAEYYRSTKVLGRLCRYSRVLKEYSGDSGVTAEYYRNPGEAVLVGSVL